MIGVILALVPLIVTLTAILVFKVKTHWAGLLGTMVTWAVAIGYSGTPLYLLPLAWIFGILVPISYFLARIVTWLMTYHIVANIGITDIRKLMKNVALIGAYGEEYKALRRTFIIGIIITAATIIPLMSFLWWS